MPRISTIQQNRLLFATGFISRRSVAREANISYYKLSRLAREGIALSGDEATRLRNVMMKFSYSHLRTLGMSTSQARRFRGASLKSLFEIKERMESVTNYLTEGAFKAMAESRDARGILYDEDLLWSEAQDAILNGLSRSRKTIEDWENY